MENGISFLKEKGPVRLFNSFDDLPRQFTIIMFLYYPGSDSMSYWWEGDDKGDNTLSSSRDIHIYIYIFFYNVFNI